MDLRIAGKVALVTGGSKGIGRAISEELGANGCKVIVVARAQDAIDATVQAVRDAGGQAVGISEDLRDVTSYARIVEQSIKAFGAPDIAVYNMEAPPPGHFDEMSDEDFLRAYHLVVTCFANMVRAVTPAMKEKKWGRIVTIGSGTVKQPVRANAGFGYVLANTNRIAAVGLSKTLASDLGPFGITVNTIATGSIGTEQFYDWFRKRGADAGVPAQQIIDNFAFQRIPLHRIGEPHEIAALCAYLCSGRLFTSGETILCDGGQVESML